MAVMGYLGYVLVFVLKDMCVVCFSTYVCNALVLLLSGARGFGRGAKAKAT
jgi:uncharacterized membrane protein